MAVSGQANLRGHAIGMVALLVIQYLLGIAAALFVHFPESGNDVVFWEFARTQTLVVLHILVAALILIGTIALWVRAIIYKNKLWQIVAGLSLMAVIVAVLGGAKFIPSQSDSYSFIMAVGFIAAFISYGWGIYSSKK